MTTKIISIHVPKAGGTSTLALWKQVFGEECVQMDYDDPPANPGATYYIDPEGWMARRPRTLGENIQVVHGHFKPSKYDLLDNAFRLTILRHPVDNLVSIYCYWRKIPPQQNPVHRYFLNYDLGIEALAMLPLIRNLYSQTYFGGWDMGRLDFIGRHESRNDDFLKLGKLLGVSLDPKIHLNATAKEGVSSMKEEILSDLRLVKRLENLLAADVRFYEKYAR